MVAGERMVVDARREMFVNSELTHYFYLQSKDPWSTIFRIIMARLQWPFCGDFSGDFKRDFTACKLLAIESPVVYTGDLKLQHKNRR